VVNILLLFLLRYKRKRSKKKIPNKSNGSAGFVDSRALLTQFSIELRGAGFYATWEGRRSDLSAIIIICALPAAVKT
jgi:hypothetical protein